MDSAQDIALNHYASVYGDDGTQKTNDLLSMVTAFGADDVIDSRDMERLNAVIGDARENFHLDTIVNDEKYTHYTNEEWVQFAIADASSARGDGSTIEFRPDEIAGIDNTNAPVTAYSQFGHEATFGGAIIDIIETGDLDHGQLIEIQHSVESGSWGVANGDDILSNINELLEQKAGETEEIEESKSF